MGDRAVATSLIATGSRRISGWLVVLTLMLAGCSSSQVLTRNGEPERPQGPVRVLLMPMQVAVGQLTAGGLVEPKADWTMAAQANLRKALEAELGGRQLQLVSYAEPADDSPEAYRFAQAIKLHNAVGKAVLDHKLSKGPRLEAKKEQFDWTLADSVVPLQQAFEADYALFIRVQRVYASEGRHALSVILSVLYVFPVLPGSGQVGYASLVNLHSGHLVWFSRIAGNQGDLRSASASRDVVKALFKELPL